MASTGAPAGTRRASAARCGPRLRPRIASEGDLAAGDRALDHNPDEWDQLVSRSSTGYPPAGRNGPPGSGCGTGRHQLAQRRWDYVPGVPGRSIPLFARPGTHPHSPWCQRTRPSKSTRDPTDGHGGNRSTARPATEPRSHWMRPCTLVLGRYVAGTVASVGRRSTALCPGVTPSSANLGQPLQSVLGRHVRRLEGGARMPCTPEMSTIRPNACSYM